MHVDKMLMLSGILAAGMVCQWLAWRIKLPAILPLLFTGFLAGPILGILHPQEELGALYFPLISLSVAVILFEGSLTLAWRDVREVASTVRNLISIGALLTWFGGAIASYYILGLPWDLALLFGALIIVTGPTVISPLLRNVRPTAKVSSVLRWEGILIDPIGATVAVLVFDFVLAGVDANMGHTLQSLLVIIAVGVILGLAGGYAVYLLLSRYLVPDYLRDTITLSLVLLIFSISNALSPESGLLAVTVMGVFLANTDLRKLRELFYFKEKVSIVLISSLFILLAANITRADIAMLTWESLALLAVVIFVLRPLGVWVSARGSTLNRNEQLFLSWISPRGIVAAAVSSLFAYELTAAGYEAARVVAPLIFLVIVGTVVLQGSTAKWVARKLGVAEADPQGFLFVGADRLAQEIALGLKNEDVAVKLIDANPLNVTQARLRGLNAIQGNILSEFLESEIDLAGIGRLLALTSNDEANALACKNFEDEFGSSEVYQLPPNLDGRRNGQMPNRRGLGRLAFGTDATYAYLMGLIEAGAVVKKTPLTQQFDFQSFKAQYAQSEMVPLMAIRGKKVVVGTVEKPLQPSPGWTVLSLVRGPVAQQPSQTVAAEALERLDNTAQAVSTN